MDCLPKTRLVMAMARHRVNEPSAASPNYAHRQVKQFITLVHRTFFPCSPLRTHNIPGDVTIRSSPNGVTASGLHGPWGWLGAWPSRWESEPRWHLRRGPIRRARPARRTRPSTRHRRGHDRPGRHAGPSTFPPSDEPRSDAPVATTTSIRARLDERVDPARGRVTRGGNHGTTTPSIAAAEHRARHYNQGPLFGARSAVGGDDDHRRPTDAIPSATGPSKRSRLRPNSSRASPHFAPSPISPWPRPDAPARAAVESPLLLGLLGSAARVPAHRLQSQPEPVADVAATPEAVPTTTRSWPRTDHHTHRTPVKVTTHHRQVHRACERHNHLNTDQDPQPTCPTRFPWNKDLHLYRHRPPTHRTIMASPACSSASGTPPRPSRHHRRPGRRRADAEPGHAQNVSANSTTTPSLADLVSDAVGDALTLEVVTQPLWARSIRYRDHLPVCALADSTCASTTFAYVRSTEPSTAPPPP